MKSIRYTLLCAVMSASLVGCGGGSNSSGPDNPPVTKTNFSVSNKNISLSAPVKVSSAKLSKVLRLRDNSSAQSSFDVMYNGAEPSYNAKNLTGVTTTHVPCSSVPNGYEKCVRYTVVFAPTNLKSEDPNGEIDFKQAGTTEGLSSEKVLVKTSIPSWPVTTDSIVYDAPNNIVKNNLVYSYDNRISVKITLPNEFKGEEFKDWAQTPTLTTSKGVKLTLAKDLSDSEKALSCSHNSYKNAAGKNACMLYFQTPPATAVGNQFGSTPLTLTMGDAKTPITVNALAAKDFFVSTYAARDDIGINYGSDAHMLRLQGPLGSIKNDTWNAFSIFEKPVKTFNIFYIDSFFANPSKDGGYIGDGLGTYSTYDHDTRLATYAAHICDGKGNCNSTQFLPPAAQPDKNILQIKASVINSNKQKALLYRSLPLGTRVPLLTQWYLYFPESAGIIAKSASLSGLGDTITYNENKHIEAKMAFVAAKDGEKRAILINFSIKDKATNKVINHIYYNKDQTIVGSSYNFSANWLSTPKVTSTSAHWMALGNSLVAVDTDGSGLTIVTPQIGADPKVTNVNFKTPLTKSAIANYSNISCTSDDLSSANNRCFIYGSKPLVMGSNNQPVAANGTASFVEFTGNLSDTKSSLLNSGDIKFANPVKGDFYTGIKIDPDTGRVLSIHNPYVPQGASYSKKDSLYYTKLSNINDVNKVSSAGWTKKAPISRNGKLYSLDKIYLY